MISNTNEDAKLKTHQARAEKLIQLVESSLDFKRWGFHRSFISITAEKTPHVIYDSQWCRVRFTDGGFDVYTGDVMSVYYGRLHADNENTVVNWNGELCYCWHTVEIAINFLDGLSPKESVDQLFVDSRRPYVMEQFEQSERGKKLSQYQPQWMAAMHAATWQHYGTRLFELFDLGQVDSWEKYVQWNKEYHRIRRSKKVHGFPARDKIC
jgi:hypothetical protein